MIMLFIIYFKIIKHITNPLYFKRIVIILLKAKILNSSVTYF